jgi:hypothetical protein
MTPPAKPVPAPGGDDDPTGPRAGEAKVDQTGPGKGPLVWPPPEDELESLEVISLGLPTASTPAPGVAPPRLEIAVPPPRRSPEPQAQPPRVAHAPAPSDTGWTAGEHETSELPAPRHDRRVRVPWWLTILLMLASGGAGFAAAWYLR